MLLDCRAAAVPQDTQIQTPCLVPHPRQPGQEAGGTGRGQCVHQDVFQTQYPAAVQEPHPNGGLGISVGGEGGGGGAPVAGVGFGIVKARGWRRVTPAQRSPPHPPPSCCGPANLGSLRSPPQVSSRQFAPFEAFPVAQRVTYRFYVGRLAVFDEDYVSGSGQGSGGGTMPIPTGAPPGLRWCQSVLLPRTSWPPRLIPSRIFDPVAARSPGVAGIRTATLPPGRGSEQGPHSQVPRAGAAA